MDKQLNQFEASEFIEFIIVGHVAPSTTTELLEFESSRLKNYCMEISSPSIIWDQVSFSAKRLREEHGKYYNN